MGALFFWDIPILTAGLNFRWVQINAAFSRRLFVLTLVSFVRHVWQKRSQQQAKPKACKTTTECGRIWTLVLWFWMVLECFPTTSFGKHPSYLKSKTSLRSHWHIRTHEASAAHSWCHHFYWSHLCPGRDGSMAVGSSSTWRHEKSRGFAEPRDLWCSLECMWEAWLNHLMIFLGSEVAIQSAGYFCSILSVKLGLPTLCNS